MKKMAILFFLAVFIFSCAGNTFAQEKVKLAYNFKAGDKLNYQMVIDGEIGVEIIPEGSKVSSKNTAKMKGNFNYSYEVKEIIPGDNTVKINVTYGKSELNTIIAEQIIPNADVASLEGKVATILLSKSGEVKKFELPKGVPPALQNADFSKMLIAFPANELRIGESWVKDAESSRQETDLFVTTYSGHAKYTLAGVEQRGSYKCAKVKFESVNNSFTKSKKPDVNLDGKVEGMTEGVIYYNLANGYVIYSELNTKIKNETVTQLKPKEDKKEEKKPIIATMILNTGLRSTTEAL